MRSAKDEINTGDSPEARIFPPWVGMDTQTSSRRAGFSLLELLVVVALIGILAALAAPSLTGYLSVSRVNRAASEIESDVARTRMEAVRRGRSASLRPAPGGSTYKITINGDDGVTEVRTVQQRDLRSDFNTISFSATTPAAITFNSRGLLDAAGGATITLVRGGKTAALQVSPIGRVTRVY